MLTNSESKSIARVHGSTRNSSLRQVISRDEHDETETAQHTDKKSGSSSSSVAPRLNDQRLVRKLLTLRVHDGSLTGSVALLDLDVFPKGTISRGALITISPASEADLLADREPSNETANVELEGTRVPLFGDGAIGTIKHLFVVEPMDTDTTTARTPSVQVVDEDHGASHVEIAFRDEYLSRSDMWRLVVSELAGKVIHKGQRLAFMGTIKILIKAIYIRGQRVHSALFSATTKPVFRSESARYVLFIQMSKEMWDFGTDGTGEIMFDKVVNGFLPDLFKRWQKINARHLVTIVMFTRLEFKPQDQAGPFTFGTHANKQIGLGGTMTRDFYRVVVSDMPSGEWSNILVQLKKEFRVFLRDVSIHATIEDNAMVDEGPSATAGEKPSHLISGKPYPASRGNILEAVNLASSQFSCDYIDRDLMRTGVSVIVITPGTGLFEVDYNLLAATTDNLIENGVGIDLVCLSRLPLHSVPLFKYRPTSHGLQKRSITMQEPNREPSTSWRSDQLRIRDKELTESRDAGNSNACFKDGAVQEMHGMDWNYGIPHWVDVSFWTASSGGNSAPFTVTRASNHSLTRDGQARRKPFIPRARMYELQMMGVMENSINQICLPVLPKLGVRRDRRSIAPSSLPCSSPPNGHSSFPSSPISGQIANGSPQTQPGSVTSRNNFLNMRQKTEYQWMNDYDEMLFRHPWRRLAIKNSAQGPGTMAPPVDKEQQHNRTSSDAAGSAGSTWSSRIRTTDSVGQSKQAFDDRTRTAKQRDSSAVTSPTVSSRPYPKAPKLSRRTSLGFRGFGISTSKATASTEVSVEHAKSISAITRRHQLARKPKDAHSDLLDPSSSIQQLDKGQSTSGAIETGSSPSATETTSSARPIPIRHPTEIRISSPCSQPQSSYQNTSLMYRLDGTSDSNKSPHQPDLLLSRSLTPSEDHRMSPKTALAPWLTVINPSNPYRTDSDSTSRLGRWQHIFPRKMRASKMKWKSLCSPAAVPLTTEVFPSAEELATDYESSIHKVKLPPDDEFLEDPRSRNWLIRELMAFRFSQGFQVVVGSRLVNSLYLPNSESFDVFDDDRLAQKDTVIIMTKGSMIHKISTAEFGHVEVECLTRRSIATHTKAHDTSELGAYKPMVRTMLAEEYAMQNIAIRSRQPKSDWTLIDSRIAGHQKQDPGQQDDDLRSWRARLVLVPVPVPSNARRSLLAHNEDDEEELRLEGIRKLTQVWQRFRHVPPSERRFQASLPKRKDVNPLDILYQTKNPSEIVAAEKDNISEDVSSGEPVQLLPEFELFQRSNLNLQILAQTIQGERGVKMTDRRWHFILHHDCFIGFELTSWLLQNFRDIELREEAVELGNELMKNGLFVHVKQRHNFRDGNYFYQMASDYRAIRPESRNSWFRSRRADKSIPSTPISEGSGQESPKAPASRAGSTEDGSEDESSRPSRNRQRLGVALSKSLLYDVDHRKRSYRPELITLHYDRLHNPDNCYHIRIDWLNVTSKFVEDAIVSWAASVERFGLKLVEVPLAEASAITSMHPFRTPALVKLAKSPPSEQPPTYVDTTSFAPQPRIIKHFYQKEIMKKFNFILDFEAASDFPADVDITYSWGKPDYKYSQYIHRSGTLLAQITDEGDFLLLANRLYNNRSSTIQDTARLEETPERDRTGAANRFGSARISPYSSPPIRAKADSKSQPAHPAKDPSTFSTPENIKKQFEGFCADAATLETFYTEVFKKPLIPMPPTPRVSTPMMEINIPTLGLPPSLVLRDNFPAAEAGRRKIRTVGGESPSLTPEKSNDNA
ncbi:MAG: hypothetical protein Q9166_001989 [cf. Caloplaca sp. 2 TL-2023]